ncbi:hypothetical protein CAOG_00568 [Capsaspora owczarzaki ATCC 30864]|uniref:hypothetical protein n=1 Tax=Capsaspora owczarzaki (strain ATCC 30864) TaxID=595528 RepID=UPI0001FE364E|nr:hypothetical protein CAOG_00568 [Capsaspora owczarzaki ATCC 30864]|eukprot:XP_004365439.1 hypothetical protein CAOG_00568 [Capsaspora owczarzaki ATCC 30864]
MATASSSVQAGLTADALTSMSLGSAPSASAAAAATHASASPAPLHKKGGILPNFFKWGLSIDVAQFTLDFSEDDLRPSHSRHRTLTEAERAALPEAEYNLDDHGDGLLLGKYTRQAICAILEDDQIAAQLRERNFPQFHVKLDTSDIFVHKLFVVANRQPHAPLLAEMYFRRLRAVDNFKTFGAHSSTSPGVAVVRSMTAFSDLDIIVLEWARMQDPNKSFSAESLKSLLPGQDAPGLGLGKQIDQLMLKLAERSKRDGLINVPLYFHNALFYSRSYSFLNPEFEGVFRTLVHDLHDDVRDKGLVKVAHAIVRGALKVAKTGQSVRWIGEEMILPVSKRLKEYVHAPEYLRVVKAFTSSGVFKIDWDAQLLSDSEWQHQGIIIKDVDTRNPEADELLKADPSHDAGSDPHAGWRSHLATVLHVFRAWHARAPSPVSS